MTRMRDASCPVRGAGDSPPVGRLIFANVAGEEPPAPQPELVKQVCHVD